jgi:hypothetical protein
MKEMVMAKFGVPSWNLPEWLGKNHKRPQAALPEPGLRFALQPPKHEAEALHITFQLSVSALYISSEMPRKI